MNTSFAKCKQHFSEGGQSLKYNFKMSLEVKGGRQEEDCHWDWLCGQSFSSPALTLLGVEVGGRTEITVRCVIFLKEKSFLKNKKTKLAHRSERSM